MRPSRRYLQGNKGTIAPTSLLFFDTESKQTTSGCDLKIVTNTLWLWTAIHVRREKGSFTRRTVWNGKSVESFWALVVSLQHPDRPLWCFAHNIGFDLTMLRYWELLERGEYRIEPTKRGKCPRTGRNRKDFIGAMCLEGRPTFIKTLGDKGVVRFVDSMNFFPTKLASIGESFGKPKMTLPPQEADEATMFSYCRNDTEIVEMAICGLISWWVREKCGCFRQTAPGLAWQNFKHSSHLRAGNGETTPIVLEDESPVRTMERDAYYGGRIEPFFVGRTPTPAFLVDVVSLYPHVMRENLYPVERVPGPNRVTPTQLGKLCDVYGCVARVRLRAYQGTYPVRHDGMQVHAHGAYVTTLCGPELMRAIWQRSVVEVLSYAAYKVQRIFRGWVDTWFRRKDECSYGPGADPIGREFAKLILNSLSGKFAQKGSGWFDRPDVISPRDWGTWIGTDPVDRVTKRFRSIARNAQEYRTSDEPPEAFPIISAFITSYAREYMRDQIAHLPERSVYYIGTDALIVSPDGMLSLLDRGMIDDRRLGAFSVKHASRRCVIHGCNWYSMGDKFCQSGHYKRSKRVVSGQSIVDVWDQLPTIISRRPDGTVQIRETPISPCVPTRKGVTGDDGWVTPLWLAADPTWGDRSTRRSDTPIDPRQDFPQEEP